MQVRQRVTVQRKTKESYFAIVVEESIAIQAAQVGHQWGLAWIEEVTRPLRAQIAARYFRAGTANAHLREEAEQEAWRGVLRALAAYRLDKGRRFVDYAQHQIRNIIGKYRQRVTHPVRLPAHQWEARHKAGRDGGDVHASVGRLMAQGKSRHEATLLCTISSVPIHLEDEDTPSYTPVGGTAPDVEIMQGESKRVVDKLLSVLPPHLARALALQADLDSGGRESLAHMSSTERRDIQTLARQAMEMLRRHTGGRSLDDYMEQALAPAPAPCFVPARKTAPIDVPCMVARAMAGDARCVTAVRKLLAAAYRGEAREIAARRSRRDRETILRAGVARAMDLLRRYNPALDVSLADQTRRAAVAAMRATARSLPQPTVNNAPSEPSTPACPEVLLEMPLVQAVLDKAAWALPWVAQVQRKVVRQAVAAGHARSRAVQAVRQATDAVIAGYRAVGTLANQIFEVVMRLLAPVRRQTANGARKPGAGSRQRQASEETFLSSSRLVPP